MKRFLKVVLSGFFAVTAVLGAVGCAVENDGSSEPALENTTLSKPYETKDLEQIIFHNFAKGLTVDMSKNQALKGALLEAEYYEYTLEEKPTEARFSLALKGVEMEIYEGGVVCFAKENGGETLYATVKNNEFALLETAFVGEAICFDGFTSAHSIKVFDEAGKGGEITGKEGFLEKWNALRFWKVSNKADYQMGESEYSLKLGKSEYAVHGNGLVFDGELYLLCEGNFDFLKEVELSDGSGFLPWI